MQHFFLLVWVLLGDWKNLQLAPLTIFSGFPNNRHNSLPRMPGPQKEALSMCCRTLLLCARKSPLQCLLMGWGKPGAGSPVVGSWRGHPAAFGLHNHLPRLTQGSAACSCLQTGRAGAGLAAPILASTKPSGDHCDEMHPAQLSPGWWQPQPKQMLLHTWYMPVLGLSKVKITMGRIIFTLQSLSLEHPVTGSTEPPLNTCRGTQCDMNDPSQSHQSSSKC